MTLISGQIKIVIRIDLKTAVICKLRCTVIEHCCKTALNKHLIRAVKQRKLLFHFGKLCRSILPHFLRNEVIIDDTLHVPDTLTELFLCLINVLLAAVVDNTVDHVVIIFHLHFSIGKRLDTELIGKFSDL